MTGDKVFHIHEVERRRVEIFDRVIPAPALTGVEKQAQLDDVLQCHGARAIAGRHPDHRPARGPVFATIDRIDSGRRIVVVGVVPDLVEQCGAAFEGCVCHAWLISHGSTVHGAARSHQKQVKRNDDSNCSADCVGGAKRIQANRRQSGKAQTNDTVCVLRVNAEPDCFGQDWIKQSPDRSVLPEHPKDAKQHHQSKHHHMPIAPLS